MPDKVGRRKHRQRSSPPSAAKAPRHEQGRTRSPDGNPGLSEKLGTRASPMIFEFKQQASIRTAASVSAVAITSLSRPYRLFAVTHHTGKTRKRVSSCSASLIEALGASRILTRPGCARDAPDEPHVLSP